MTINFSAGDKPPADMLAITEDWLREAAETLATTVQAIKAGEFGRIKDSADCIKGLKVAVALAIEEGNRVEKLRKQIAGPAGGRPPPIFGQISGLIQLQPAPADRCRWC